MTDFKSSVTWKEILQQPSIWKEEISIVKENLTKLRAFVDEIKSDKLRVIFTGAGSSEFVGNTVCKYIDNMVNFEVVSIPTTDIVSMPEMYLASEVPTIMISCARSGNSPESVATVNLANKIIKNVRHIFITCNANGELAKISKATDNAYLLLMPEKSNDQGFAMTGSFSSMLTAGVLIFSDDKFEKFVESVELVSTLVENNIEEILKSALEVTGYDNNRIIYLGDGPMKGLAEEVALKILELTAGQVVSAYNTFLGFRHGPKSIVNDKTTIICMMSNDEHARIYEKDLIREFKNETGNKKVVVLDSRLDEEISNIVDKYFNIGNGELSKVEDVFLSLFYLVYGQMISIIESAKLEIQPDNPCPTGEVNRVVKGVIVHEYK